VSEFIFYFDEFIMSFEGKVCLAILGLLMVLTSIVLSFLNSRKEHRTFGTSQFEEGSALQDEITASQSISETSENLNSKKTSEEFPKLSEGLSKSRLAIWKKLQSLVQKKESKKDDFFLSFEELLIESDIGVSTSTKLVKELSEEFKENTERKFSLSTFKDALKDRITSILEYPEEPEIEPEKVEGNAKVVMVVGVNGAGKTTTIGKLAFQFRAQGANVLIAACDTFRAAATGQLEVWCDRAGALIEKGADGEKPSTVAYRAIQRAKDENIDIVLIDTAGRLHNKINLMNELSSITNVISKLSPGSPHETLLVLDGSTGQNALSQAREFNSATSLTGLVITKLDGTQKGGIVIAIKDELNIPVRYLGVGEGVGDLRPFDSREFSEALFGSFDLSSDEVLIDFSNSDSVISKVSINASSLE